MTESSLMNTLMTFYLRKADEKGEVGTWKTVDNHIWTNENPSNATNHQDTSEAIVKNIVESIYFLSSNSGHNYNESSNLYYDMKDIHSMHGVSTHKMIRDMTVLMGKNGILPEEYLEYQLYLKSRKEQLTYIGGTALYAYWDRYNFSKRINNKLLSLLDLHSNLHILDTIIGKEHLTDTHLFSRTLLNELKDGKQIADFHAQTKEKLISYGEFFVKHNNSVSGKGAFKMHYDREIDMFIELDKYKQIKRIVTYYELINSLQNEYVFQPIIKHHPSLEIDTIPSSGLNTIRVVSLKGRIIGASLKIAANGNIADNMSKKGNYITTVDKYTGEIGTSFSTSKDFLGIKQTWTTKESTVPNWKGVIDLVTRLNEMFGNKHLLGYDVTVDTSGTVKLIEINSSTGIRILQIPHKRGFKPDFNQKITS